MTQIPNDKDAQKFSRHIGGHACFQAIMHIVTELDAPDFKAPHLDNQGPLRSRALAALETTMDLRRGEASPPWYAFNRIIANCLAKGGSQTTTATASRAARTLDEAAMRDMTAEAGTVPAQSRPADADSGSVPEDDSIFPAAGAPWPDLSELGTLDLQDHAMAFNWVSESDLVIDRAARTNY